MDWKRTVLDLLRDTFDTFARPRDVAAMRTMLDEIRTTRRSYSHPAFDERCMTKVAEALYAHPRPPRSPTNERELAAALLVAADIPPHRWSDALFTRRDDPLETLLAAAEFLENNDPQ